MLKSVDISYFLVLFCFFFTSFCLGKCIVNSNSYYSRVSTIIGLSTLVILINWLDYLALINRHNSLIIILALILVSLVLIYFDVSKFINFQLLLEGLCLCVLFVILSFPLLLNYDIAIPGKFIVDDSVIHSLLSKGYDFTSRLDLHPYYKTGYPRGFHSSVHFIASFLNVEPNEILPFTLNFFYSFIIFPVHYFTTSIFQEKYKTLKSCTKEMYLWPRLLILLSLMSCIPYINYISTYLIFASQMSATPFVLALLVSGTLCNEKFLELKNYTKLVKIRKLSEFCQNRDHINFLVCSTLLLASIISIYWILYLIPLYALITIRTISIDRLSLIAKVREATLRCITYSLFLILALLILFPISTYPIARVILVKLNFISDSLFDQVLNSDEMGNLIGFISPLHVFGFWLESDYRVSYSNSLVASVSLYYIFIVLVIISKVFLNNIFRKQIALALSILLSLIFISWTTNPYVSFKIMTLLAPVILCIILSSLLIIFHQVRKKYRFFVFIILTLQVIAVTLSPYPAVRIIPYVHYNEINEMKNLAKLIDSRSVEVISRNDWLQYYLRSPSNNAYLPYTRYIPNPSPLDQSKSLLILEDNAYFKELNYSSQENSCLVYKSERYLLFYRQCDS